MKIKKGDQVQIMSGKDKGKKGKIISVLPRLDKVVIDKLNIVKRHSKPKRDGEKGQIVEVPAPFDVSNVMIVCPSCNKISRIGFSGEGKKKTRICKKCKKEL